jgi:hypothetical protein
MKNHFKNNWYLYLIGVLIVLIIIKLLKDKATPFKLGGSFGSNNNQNSPVSFTNDNPDVNIILKKGSQGNEVKVLQSAINKEINDNPSNTWIDWITSDLVADGIFGQLTENHLFYLTAKNEITLAEFNALI